MRFLEHEVSNDAGSLRVLSDKRACTATLSRLSNLLTQSCCILFLAFVFCSVSSWFDVRYSCHLLGFFGASGNIYNQPLRFSTHKSAECLGACENWILNDRGALLMANILNVCCRCVCVSCLCFSSNSFCKEGTGVAPCCLCVRPPVSAFELLD